MLCRIDTLDEIEYYRSSGILQYVLRRLSGRLRPEPRLLHRTASEPHPAVIGHGPGIGLRLVYVRTHPEARFAIIFVVTIATARRRRMSA